MTVDFFKRYPLTTLVTWGATVLAVLAYLREMGYLTGSAARWAELAAGVLQLLLTLYARQHVTPVVNPKDDEGRQLVPAKTQPFRSGGSI